MSNIKKRGLASLSIERRREIASMGGKASGGNFKHSPERASIAGKKSRANRGLAYEKLESEPNA